MHRSTQYMPVYKICAHISAMFQRECFLDHRHFAPQPSRLAVVHHLNTPLNADSMSINIHVTKINDTVKVKAHMCLVKLDTIRTYGRVRMKHHAFLNSPMYENGQFQAPTTFTPVHTTEESGCGLQATRTS